MTTPIYAANGGSATGNGLVPYTPTQTMIPVEPELTFNDRQIAIIRNQIAPDVNDGELQLFLEVCRTVRLNPIFKQIYAIVRSKDDPRNRKMTIQTGIDGYRLLAARTRELAGIDDAEFEIDPEESWHPRSARVTVWRFVMGQRVPFTATARWSEYAQRKSNGEYTGMWSKAKMPFAQLAKCAEALALRKACPAELSGIYTNEEMDQADNQPLVATPYVEASVEQAPVTPKRAAAAAPAPVPAAKPAAWNAMEDLDVQQALNRLGVRGQQASYAYLKAMRAEMKAQGLVWTPATVDTQLMDRIRQADEAAAAERVDAVTDDAHSLDELDTGIPG